MDKNNILIVDDHRLVREGLKSILKNNISLNVIGEAGTFDEGYKKAIALSPHIILMDVSIHGLSGIELANQLLKIKPELKIIMISMYARTEYIIKAIEYGARGYILKDSDSDRILEGIRTVLDGELFIDSHVSSKVIGKLMNKEIKNLPSFGKDNYKNLSLREQEILYLLVDGISIKDIAKQLFISKKTVETHKSSIMNKLSCNNLVELVRYAIQIGLVD